MSESVPWPAVGLAGVAVGLSLGWALWAGQRAPIAEAPAAEQRLDGGALVLARSEPGQPADPPRPPAELPRGTAGIERLVRVVVQPVPQSRPHSSNPAVPCPDPEPVKVDLALLRMKDGTRRVVASSPGGTILAGVDVPMGLLAPPEPRPPLAHALGLSYRLLSPAVGLWYERDLAWLRVGGEVSYRLPTAAAPPALEALVRAGVRF